MNYYNEIDPFAAQWMRNLIAAGHIAPGIVDERSIEDVRPDDLRGFTQCHFFAGIGVWSYALRQAGWPDDRPVWTGSCPCQPFSQAGEGSGFDDERHLWPHFHWLIQEHRPAAILGEQVASKDAEPWLNLVHTDLEVLGYAFGAVPFPSAGVGAPHIRDRLFWVAHANGGAGRKGRADFRWRADRGHAQPWAGSGSGGVLDGMGHTASPGPQGGERGRQLPDAQLAAIERVGEAGGLGHAGQHDGASQGQAASAGQPQAVRPADQLGRPGAALGGLGHAEGLGRKRGTLRAGPGVQAHGTEEAGIYSRRPGPVNGFWRDADWLLCRDGRWRPVEPGTFPLAHGVASRVGRLRAYGNAINAEAARAFIEVVMECAP